MSKKQSKHNTLANRERDKISHASKQNSQRVALTIPPLPKLEKEAEKLLSMAGRVAALAGEFNAVAHELSSQFKSLSNHM